MIIIQNERIYYAKCNFPYLSLTLSIFTLTGYLIKSLALKVQKMFWPRLTSSAAILLRFQILGALFELTDRHFYSNQTSLQCGRLLYQFRAHKSISYPTLHLHNTLFSSKKATQSECLVSTEVVKQVTYTNTEQETNPLPVCNIPAVSHYIDRCVLIGGRVESNKVSFVANGYFLRVSPPPSVASYSINIHKPSQLVRLLKIGILCPSKTDIYKLYSRFSCR